MSYIGRTPTSSALTSSDITDGVITTAKIADSAVTTEKIGADINFRNIIINGDMSIDQRNSGSSVTVGTVNPLYTLDRMAVQSSQSSKFSIQQNAGSVTPPEYFKNYIGATSLSAYSIASGDYFTIRQGIEGSNIINLAWGTSDAKTVTLSFWVRSSLTGTFGGSFTNDGFNRSYPFSYTISSANTWEKKSITVAGDTSGTWLTTNGLGIYVTLGLGVGSTYSGTVGSWSASGLLSATGATSVVGTNGATFYVTGIQLEAGTTASDFEFLPVDVNLERCQRYYHVVSSGTGNPICIGSMYSSSALHGVVDLPTSMRVRPSIDQTTGTSYYNVYRGGGNDPFNSLVLNFSGTGTENIINFVNETEISGTAGQAGLIVTANSGSYFAVDAEL